MRRVRRPTCPHCGKAHPGKPCMKPRREKKPRIHCPFCGKNHLYTQCKKRPQGQRGRSGASPIPPAPDTSVITRSEPLPESKASGGEHAAQAEQPLPSRIPDPAETTWPEAETVLTFSFESGHEGASVDPPETPRVRWDLDPTQPNGLRASCTVDYIVDAEPADSLVAQAEYMVGPMPVELAQPLDDPLALRPLSFDLELRTPSLLVDPRDFLAEPGSSIGSPW